MRFGPQSLTQRGFFSRNVTRSPIEVSLRTVQPMAPPLLVALLHLAALQPPNPRLPTTNNRQCAQRINTQCQTKMIFESFKKAFENDDSLGTRSNAGLSKQKQTRTITWVGPNKQKKTSVVIPGQSLRDIARASGVPIKYDCENGKCKTCEAKVGNGRAKICVSKAVICQSMPILPCLSNTYFFHPPTHRSLIKI